MCCLILYFITSRVLRRVRRGEKGLIFFKGESFYLFPDLFLEHIDLFPFFVDLFVDLFPFFVDLFPFFVDLFVDLFPFFDLFTVLFVDLFF